MEHWSIAKNPDFEGKKAFRDDQVELRKKPELTKQQYTLIFLPIAYAMLPGNRLPITFRTMY
jgi:hypothetical protein